MGERALLKERHSMARLKNDLAWCLGFAIGVAALLSVLPWLGWDALVVDIAAHFRLQYLILSIVGLAVFVVRRAAVLGAVSAGCLLINGVALAPYYLERPAQASVSTDGSIRVLLMNVFTRNRHFDEAATIIENADADVVALLEVDTDWLNALLPRLARYPYHVEQPRTDNFGIALLSKFPFEGTVRRLEPDQPPIISAHLAHPSGVIHIVAAHPTPPRTAEGYHLRNRQLESLATLIRTGPQPALLLADLNLSMWAPHFRRLLASSGLTDTRRAFGLLPTWPAQFFPLSTPIDHCLATTELTPTSLRSITIPGSDHRGLLLEVVRGS